MLPVNDARNSLLTLLEQYHPTDTDEQLFKRDTITFVKQHPDCFERTRSCGHITASSWLLNDDQSQVLLTHHKKLNAWFQLGGHCDGISDVLQVAIKEAQEESGIIHIKALSPAIFDIDVHLIPANSKEAAHFHYDIRFLLGVMGNQQIILSDESHDLRWFGKDIATFPTHSRSVARMFDKWLKL